MISVFFGCRGSRRLVPAFLALCLLLACFLCPAFASEADEDAVDLTAQRVVMQPDIFYSLNDNKKATYMVISAAGDYWLTGSSSNTLLIISAPENAEVTLHLNGVKMTPNESAPGTLVSRSPLTVEDTGAVVCLKSAANSTNTFIAYNAAGGAAAFNYTSYPAIRKDGLKTKLIFRSEGDGEERGWGKIIAKADETDLFTPGIGCYDRYMSEKKYTFGNVWFESGIIEATGANGTASSFTFSHVSGPGIGGGWGTTVDGLHFTGASVCAYALSPSSAAIGTSVWGENVVIGSFPVGVTVHNIEITGGKVRAEIVGSEHSTVYYGSAAIGGGTFCGAEGIRISGGTVEALAGNSTAGAGIGGGYCGDGGTPDAPIEITGGTVTAVGGSAGIGAGQYSSNPSFAGYGNAVIHISGDASVTASSTNGGPGIGGNANTSKGAAGSKTEIVISGGTVSATGSLGGAGIGASRKCSVKSITVSGGKVTAKGGSSGVGIGTSCVYDATTVNNNTLGSVTITGGRVKATGSPAGIGGMAVNKSGHHTPCENIFISGGNVAATVYEVTPKDRSGGVPVQMHGYVLLGGGTAFDLNAQRVTGLASEPESSFVSGYGTNDMYLFGAGTADEAGVYVWLDAAYPATAVTVDGKTVYTGFDSVKPNGMEPHYPPIRAVLKADTVSLAPGSSAADGSALLRHAYHTASDLKDASAAGQRPLAYLKEDTLSADAKVMDANGTLVPGADPLTTSDGAFRASEAMLRDGVTLYALWGEVCYDILFDAGRPETASTEPSGSVDPITDIHGSAAVTLPQNGFTLPGYVFTGWGTSAGGGAVYQPGESVHDLTVDTSVTLYAQWEPRAYRNTYTDGNGHSYVDSEYRFDEEFGVVMFDYLADTEGFTLPEGRTFAGWRRTNVLPGQIYAEGAVVRSLCTVNPDGSLTGWTLEAVSTEDSLFAVTVTVDDLPQKSLSAALTLSDGSSVFTLSGPDGNGVFSAPASLAAGMTLYFDGQDTGIRASGEGESVLLAFYTCTAAAGEHIASVSLSVREGQSGVLYGDSVLTGSSVFLTAVPEPCYAFDHWAPQSAAEKAGGDPEENPLSLTVTGRLALTAEARDASYTVSFDPNGGSGMMPLQSWTCHRTYTLPACRFVREDHRFTGWNTRPDGRGTAYGNGGSVSDLGTAEGETVILYAQWQRSPYTVRFDPNGGEGSMQDLRAFRGLSTSLSPNAFTRGGFRFVCWNDMPDGSGQEYADEEEVLNLAPDGGVCVLYAQWRVFTEYHITYGNGSVWLTNGKKALRFIADGRLEDFASLVVDGKTVAPKHYKTASGSTVLDLKVSWLKTLKRGAHTLKMVYTDGETDVASFTVTAPPPPTGDGTPVLFLAGILTVSAALVPPLLRRRKKQ